MSLEKRAVKSIFPLLSSQVNRDKICFTSQKCDNFSYYGQSRKNSKCFVMKKYFEILAEENLKRNNMASLSSNKTPLTHGNGRNIVTGKHRDWVTCFPVTIERSVQWLQDPR